MASVTVRSKNFLPPRLAVEKVWFSRNLSETGYEQTANHRRQNVVDIATCVKNLKGQWRRLRSVVRIFCLPGWRSKRFDFRVILARQATKSLNLVEIRKAVVWSTVFGLYRSLLSVVFIARCLILMRVPSIASRHCGIRGAFPNWATSSFSPFSVKGSFMRVYCVRCQIIAAHTSLTIWDNLPTRSSWRWKIAWLAA